MVLKKDDKKDVKRPIIVGLVYSKPNVDETKLEQYKHVPLAESKRPLCKPVEGQSVYDRLFNEAGYTGMHKYRKRDNKDKIKDIRDHVSNVHMNYNPPAPSLQ